MVVLVLGSPILPSKNNFVKALLKLHPEITTIVLNVNDKRRAWCLGIVRPCCMARATLRMSSAAAFPDIPEILLPDQFGTDGKALCEGDGAGGLSGKERVIDATAESVRSADRSKKGKRGDWCRAKR